MAAPKRQCIGCLMHNCTFVADCPAGLYAHVKQRHAWHKLTNNQCRWDGCTKLFKTKSKYEAHLRTHTGERPYQCTYVDVKTNAACLQAFAEAGNLACHIRIHTGERPYFCKYIDPETGAACQKAFAQSGDLVKHLRIHTGERPYKCIYIDPETGATCSLAFAEPGNLVRHVRIHTGQRPYLCKYNDPETGAACPQAFMRSGDLVKHLRIHSGQRPHPCTFIDPETGAACQKAFAEAGNLACHIRIHTGERPYFCKYVDPVMDVACSKAFAQSGDLVKHLRTHTDERPNKCEHIDPETKLACSRAFAASGNLVKHMRIHTGPFCTTCARYVVPEEGMICGFCALGSTYGVKERIVFEHLARADWRFNQLVRDMALGCGSRRRPDGYVVLSVDIEETHVLFVIEVDEHQHRYYNVSCELQRLIELQERHGGPLYMLRYNPDQPDGLEEDMLDALAERCLDILETDHMEAVQAFGGLIVEYHGYSADRIEKLDRAWFESQDNK